MLTLQIACNLTEGKSYGGRRVFASEKSILMSTLVRLIGSLKSNLDQKMMREAEKGYEALKDEFREAMFGILSAYQRGEITDEVLEQMWRAEIKDAWEKAYRFGVRSVGNPFGVWEEDESWLKGAEREEFGYLGKFVEDIKKNELVMSLEDRLDMYIETLDGVYFHGKVDGSPEFVKIHWILRESKHCDDCIRFAAGSPYTKKTLPAVPRDGTSRCMASKFTSVYTDKGWKPIYKIKKGDMVLTHKGRFREVLDTLNEIPFKERRITEDVIVVFVKVQNKKKEISIPVTEDHEFYTFDGSWERAKDLKVGDKVFIASKKCKSCGEYFPLIYRSIREKEYCKNCYTLPANKRVKHLVSLGMFLPQKNKGKKVEEIYGEEKGKEIRNKLLNKVPWNKGIKFNELYGERKSELLKEKFKVLYKGKRLEEKLGPERAIEVKQKISIAAKKIPKEKLFGGIENVVRLTIERNKTMRGKKYEELYGEEKAKKIKEKIIISNIKQGLIKRSSIEFSIEKVLEQIGVSYEPNKQIGPYIVDFFLPNLGMVIECDGDYWHSLPRIREKDIKKDSYLKELGFEVIHFSENEIRNNLNDCYQRIERLVSNHQGGYGLISAEIVAIKRRKPIKGSVKYDLTVDEDHSYVAKGFVVHNCLSNCKCELRFEYAEQKPEPEAFVIKGPKPVIPPEGYRLPTRKEADKLAAMDAEIDRLRELIKVTTGDVKKELIRQRRDLNNKAIEFMEKHRIYWVPGMQTQKIKFVESIVNDVRRELLLE